MHARSLAILAIATLLVAPSHAAEIVIDGGFDDPAHPAWEFQQYDVASTIAWSADDASGSPSSGSLSLRKTVGENPNSLRAQQCIDVVPGATYDASAALFWPATSNESEGTPSFRIQWSEESACAGAALTATDPFSSFGTERDAWVALGPSSFDVPADAHSGRLYVGVVAYVELGSPAFFEARWDQVSIVPEPAAGAATAALAGLSLLALRRRARS